MKKIYKYECKADNGDWDEFDNVEKAHKFIEERVNGHVKTYVWQGLWTLVATDFFNGHIWTDSQSVGG